MKKIVYYINELNTKDNKSDQKYVNVKHEYIVKDELELDRWLSIINGSYSKFGPVTIEDCNDEKISLDTQEEIKNLKRQLCELEINYIKTL